HDLGTRRWPACEGRRRPLRPGGRLPPATSLPAGRCGACSLGVRGAGRQLGVRCGARGRPRLLAAPWRPQGGRVNIVAIAASIVLAYAIGRLDGRGRLPHRREDTEATPDLASFEGRLRRA